MAIITGEEDTVEGVLAGTAEFDTLKAHSQRSTTLEPGDRVGRYVVLAPLGEGGMGVVLSAYDPELDRKVAVKLVRAESSSSNSRDRMIREARAMAKLAHPNVISVFDAGEHEGAIYIAMEFVEGSTLTHRLGSRASWAAVLDLLVPAGRGLVAAHERGLIHRDFKPDNVMVADDGRVLVMDFGLARSEGDTGPSEAATKALELTDSRVSAALGDSRERELTRAGALMGTPSYMAPEQFLGADVDEQADQFAFCVALWEGLFGERPFDGHDVWELAIRVTKGQRRPHPSSRDVPRWLLAVLNRGLNTDPEQRWPSMAALLHAIEQGRTRRRRRAVTLAVASPLLLAAIAYGGYRAWVQQTIDRCEARTEVAMPWPGRADALERGMLSTDRPFAAKSHSATVEVLDRWRETWLEMYTDACLDERLHHTVEPAVREAQVDCLESTVRTTERMLDLLESGDTTMLVFAVDHVTWVTNLEPCRDTLALARRPHPEPEVAELANRAEDQLNEMVMLHLSGRYEPALELGNEALELMEQTGFDAGIAQAKVRMGSLLADLGRKDEARPLLEDAYFISGAIAEDDMAAEAARHLVGLGAGPAPHGIERIRDWARHAMMLHDRLGMSDSLEQAEVYELLSYALAGTEEPTHVPEQIELIRRARDLRVEKAGNEHPTVLVADFNLAVHAAEADPEASLEPIRECSEKLLAALGDDHPALIGMRLELGILLAARGRTTEAQAEFDQAITMAQHTFGPDHPEVARARQIREESVATPRP